MAPSASILGPGRGAGSSASCAYPRAHPRGGLPDHEVRRMSKGKDTKKEAKKKAEKSLMEKRAAKRAKKQAKG
jgi:hypothetical protein